MALHDGFLNLVSTIIDRAGTWDRGCGLLRDEAELTCLLQSLHAAREVALVHASHVVCIVRVSRGLVLTVKDSRVGVLRVFV